MSQSSADADTDKVQSEGEMPMHKKQLNENFHPEIDSHGIDLQVLSQLPPKMRSEVRTSNISTFQDKGRNKRKINQGSIKSWFTNGVRSTPNAKPNRNECHHEVVEGGKNASELSSIVSPWNEDLRYDQNIVEEKTAERKIHTLQKNPETSSTTKRFFLASSSLPPPQCCSFSQSKKAMLSPQDIDFDVWNELPEDMRESLWSEMTTNVKPKRLKIDEDRCLGR